MKKNLFVVSVLLSAWLAPGASADERRDLSGIAEIIRARTDYQRMLIEAKLADAQVQLDLAEAELKHAQAAYIRQMMQVLQYEFDRVKREEIMVKSRISEIEFYASRCAGLKIGEVTDVTFYGLRWVLVSVLPPGVIALEMGKVVPALDAENFRPARKAFPGGNLGQLFTFLEKNQLSMTEWSPAHFHVLGFMGAVVSSVQERIQRYHHYMDGIRAGTLDVWQLPKE